MRMVDGIEVPETIGEARTLNYEQLKKACDVFNNHGISADDIKKQWDNHWWSGFDAAIELVKNHLENCESIDTLQWAEIMDGIDENVDLYKKDG